jgi:NADP-dependent 3-hydroxy acid dehydrogenase YdfG
MKKIALITGATSGIGLESARVLASMGMDIIITGRREDRLISITNELIDKYRVNVKYLAFDIRDKESVNLNIKSLSNGWEKIDILINNAGLAVGLSPFDKGELEDWERMIDTNLKGLIYISKAVVTNMINNGKGHIINIGSIAGKQEYVNGNIYCATKHAVDSLTRSMLLDLNPYNIKVSQISPGAVETEFSIVRFKGDIDKANSVYKGFIPLEARDIANVVKFIVSAPDHVNISDIVVLPTAQASASIIKKN